MANIDIMSNVDVDLSLVKEAVTSTATGASSDISDYHAASVIINAGAWTDGTHTFAVQESDDDSAWSAVATADLYGANIAPVIDGATDDDQKYRIGYKGNKRYLRVVSTVSGTTTGAIYGVQIVKGYKTEGLLS